MCIFAVLYGDSFQVIWTKLQIVTASLLLMCAESDQSGLVSNLVIE